MWHAWLDPTKTIAVSDDEREMIAIFEHVDPQEQQQDVYPNAEPPTLEDLEWSDADYLLGAGDVVNIGVLDLYGEGQEAVLVRVVSNEGYIQLPYLTDRIRVEGLTTHQVADVVANRYQGEFLLNPVVNVTAVDKRQNFFSIAGAIARANRYGIPRRDFRLLEAIAVAGDVIQNNLEYVYVIRKTEAVEGFRKPTAPAVRREVPPTPEALPPLPGEAPAAPTPPAVQPAAPTTDLEAELEKFMPGGDSTPAPAPAPAPAPTTPAPAPAPPAPTTAPAAPPAGSLSPLEAEMKRLEGVMTPATPVPSSRPVKPNIMHLSETASVGGRPVKPASQNGELVWTFKDNDWVRVPVDSTGRAVAPIAEPAAEVAQAPGETPVTPPAAVTERPITPAAPAATPVKAVPAAAPAPRPAVRPAALPKAAPSTDPEDPFGWAQADMSSLARIIAIDIQKLKEGDPRQNIIIRDGDMVIIPPLKVGEFYVMGEVPRPGVFSLTGRKITVKQALAAAGGFGQLAWPSNSVLIRRIGKNQELRIPLRLDRIMAGKEPELLLKPDDIIAVGTSLASPFLAVIRNSFRMTYGFGFIYDRNFAERNFGQYNGFEKMWGDD